MDTKHKKQINLSKRPVFARMALPDLVGFIRSSYDDAIEIQLTKFLQDSFPIEDTSQSKYKIEFVSLHIDPPIDTEETSFQKLETNYGSQMKAVVKFHNKSTNTIKKEVLNFGLVPKMTTRGTFIWKGIERVIVSQVVRSYGITFTRAPGEQFGARIIPGKGTHLVFESDINNGVYLRVDSRSRVPITHILYFFGYTTKKSLFTLFEKQEERDAVEHIFKKTEDLEKEEIMRALYKVFYKNTQADMGAVEDSVKYALSEKAFNLGDAGRISMNKKCERVMSDIDVKKHCSVDAEDFVGVLKKIVKLNSDPKAIPDDIDHLGNRRVRLPGELFMYQARRQLYSMARQARNRMASIDPVARPDISASDILYPRSFAIAVKDFFDGFSQPLHQKNAVDLLEHNRTFTMLGTGGLTRQQASVQVRDLHQSHYGRLCPINTPDGASVGLVLHPALYTRVNKYGFLECPYAKVVNGVVTDTIEYLTADTDDKHKITHAEIDIDDSGRITQDVVEVRYNGSYLRVPPKEIEYIDVSPAQPFSIAASLVPLLQHNLMMRTFYGANMQRQALPCFHPQAPLIATGLEKVVATATQQIIVSDHAGKVSSVDAKHITVSRTSGNTTYQLSTFKKRNEKSFSLHFRPSVSVGDEIQAGDTLAENHGIQDSQVAIGKNIRVAFACAFGNTYEDAIVISERLVHKDVFTSVQVQEHILDVRDTKLGPEITTYDIANVSENRLRNLDEEGIVRIGSIVRAGDILVGRISPRGEVQPSPEERLLQSIFGEKAKDVRDNSLRLPPGQQGRVIDVKIFRREDDHMLQPNVNKKICITVAEIRKVEVGDKLANRHGNKGVISKILPIEDMPYTEDGEPIDIILTPLGVPSRRNPGQILELYLGRIAEALGSQIIVPSASKVDFKKVAQLVEEAGVPKDGKDVLYDGRTGEPLKQKTAVGVMYMMKLDHMVKDKIQTRSVGPYTLISQQPTGGKSRNGGLRLGEMEVWAMLAHGAAYNLREMITIKSDDIRGRYLAQNAIIQGKPITYTGTPASFNVLLSYLKSLSLNIELLKNTQE